MKTWEIKQAVDEAPQISFLIFIQAQYRREAIGEGQTKSETRTVC